MASEELLKRTPPHSNDAEKACIGAMMGNNPALNTVLEILSPEDFYDEKHTMIFTTIRELRDESSPADMVTIANKLEANGNLERIGGSEYLLDMTSTVPSASSAEYYSKIVLEKSILRQLIQAALKIVDDVFEFQSDVEKLSDEAERGIFEITSRRVRGKYVILKDIIAETLANIDRLSSSDHIYTGLPVGFVDFDDLTNGLQPSTLNILAARPSMGKTALAMNMAANVTAANKDNAVLIFSLEMADQELALRLLACESGIPLKNIQTGRLSKAHDWAELTDAAGRLAEWKIIIDDTAAISINEIRSKSRKIFSRYKINLIVIDHIQLITTSNSGKSSFSSARTNEMSFISRNLKALAKELDIPVLALSQLNRKAEDRPDKKPLLSDLRESGAIEQDADIVALLYRDEYYNKESSNKPGQADLIIAKNRSGATGTIHLSFMAELVKFGGYSGEHTSNRDGKF